MKKAEKYKQAGVDLEEAKRLVDIVKKYTQKLPQKGVISNIGTFAGCFSINTINYKNPILIASTDGVGTKIKVACMANKHKGIGIDLVAMCVNDIITCGAKPLFFLDYIAFSKFDRKIFEELIEGIVEGCKISECALIGGETAEMPNFYKDEVYDCAGFVVGIVEKEKLIDSSEVSIGDILIGIESNGVHSNGFSLIRKIFFEEKKISPEQYIEELKKTLIEELLIPTKIYYPIIKTLLLHNIKIKSCAHITGGGLIDNLERILPPSCKAVIKKDAWEWKPIFKLIQELGNVSEEEMYRVFNCGIGFVVIVNEEVVEEILNILNALGEKGYIIGRVEEQKTGEEKVVFI